MKTVPHDPATCNRDSIDWLGVFDPASGVAFYAEPAAEPTDMAEELDCQAAYFRGLGTDFGVWLAAQLTELAATARHLHAADPATFDDRLGALVHTDADKARLRHLSPAQQGELQNLTARAYHSRGV